MRRSQRPIVTKKPQPAAESKPNDRRQSLRLNHGPSSVEMKRDTDDNRNEGDCECDMGVCDEPVVNTPDAPVEKAPVETAPVEKATTTINVDDVDNFTEPAANRTYKLSKIPDDVYFGEVTVPLHQLYAYDSDSSDDDLVVSGRDAVLLAMPSIGTSRRRGRGLSGRAAGVGEAAAKATVSVVVAAAALFPGKRGRKPAHLSSNEETRLKHMKKCLRAAGLSVEHRDLFTADKSANRTSLQLANDIQLVLQDSGLEGEATLENCERLRRVRQRLLDDNDD